MRNAIQFRHEPIRGAVHVGCGGIVERNGWAWESTQYTPAAADGSWDDRGTHSRGQHEADRTCRKCGAAGEVLVVPTLRERLLAMTPEQFPAEGTYRDAPGSDWAKFYARELGSYTSVGLISMNDDRTKWSIAWRLPNGAFVSRELPISNPDDDSQAALVAELPPVRPW